MSERGRKFDLNMEEVLKAWSVADATREVIANALNEGALTETAAIHIAEDDDGRWHARDYGRGLHHEHLPQNEDEEKLANPDLVIRPSEAACRFQDAFVPGVTCWVAASAWLSGL